MDFGKFIEDYFISPMWERTGYNAVNTLAYALIALVCLYIIYRLLEKAKINLDRSFLAGAIAWVCFGSSLRVVVDSIDGGRMAGVALQGGLVGGAYLQILNSHLLDYGPLVISPGIYVVVAFLFLTSVWVERKTKIKYFSAIAGGALALMAMAILLPMLKNFSYAFAVIALALIGTGIGIYFAKIKGARNILPVFAQALDGAATWITIDIFGPASGVAYFEQHVVPSAVGKATPLGFGLFFLLKLVFSILAVKIICSEKDERLKNYALLVIAIIGLAPGLRDLLRMAAGT